MPTSSRLGPFSFGIEAPLVPAALLFGSVLCFGLAALTGFWGWIISGVILLVPALIFLNTTLRGKRAIWERELDRLSLRGDERLLDLGCGRGAVLIAAAMRLPMGHADGVDIWHSRDQSGNTPETAARNADLAGVADKVTLHTADLVALPFADETFDVVTSALTLHNIHDPSRRATALREAVRVLRPGGRLLIADVSHAAEYAKVLGSIAADVEVRSLGPGYWYAGPWMAASMVTATRPAT